MRLLSRFLRRLLEVFVRHLQIMLHGHRHTVPNPGRCYVSGKLVCQFRFTGAAKVLPQFWPWLHTGPFDDPLKLGAEIHATVAIAGNAILGSRFGLLWMKRILAEKSRGSGVVNWWAKRWW